MKISFLIIFINLSIYNALGQINKNDSVIFYKAFREISKATKIAYVDRTIYKASLAILISNIKDGKLQVEGRNNFIKITKEEQKYLLDKMIERTTLPENLFPNSQRVDSSIMFKYLKIEREKHKELIKKAGMDNDSTLLIQLQKEWPLIFVACKPIYLRSQTLCLISFYYYCGMGCGGSESLLYRMENSEWTRWHIIERSVF